MRPWLALLAVGCFVTDTELEEALDRDGDGYLPTIVEGGDDCDETRADVNPGANEVCGDGLDNDCDGIPDDDGVGSRTWFLDADGDGFGIDETVTACTEPEGYAPSAGDCDDDDPSLNPAADDLCDGIDQDCDGIIDDEVVLTPWYRDDDGDQFGTEDDVIFACDEVSGYALADGDCDDGNAGIFPNAEDGCDGIDQDCDGIIDDDVVQFVQYADDDGDGFGREDASITACVLEPGYAVLVGDCDDTDPGFNPQALDLCDGFDQDCNGQIDDDAVFRLFFQDRDGDGVGDTNVGVETCGLAPGFVAEDGDCDDDDPDISPLIPDLCDGVDQDCDGVVDDDAVVTLYFEDVDGDGVGSASVEACTAAPGFVLEGGDCDDADPNVSPLILDVCDGVDQDCDGVVDDDAVVRVYFEDLDGDQFGSDVTMEACAAPDGFVSELGDCNDADDTVRPGSVDPCDGIDQDCDGMVDEDETFALFFRDFDEDGLGTVDETVASCDGAPAGFVSLAGDCDDADASVAVPIWYADADSDGFGIDVTVGACEQPAGYASVSGDCDDGLPGVNPGAVETCNNGLDDDCSSETDCRLRGTLTPDDADMSFVVPDGYRVAEAYSVSDGSPWRLVLTSLADTIVIDGATLDPLAPVMTLPGSCGELLSDLDGNGVRELACHRPDGVDIFDGAGSGVPTPFVQVSTASSTVRSEFAVTAGAELGPGVWVARDSSVDFFAGMSGTLTELDISSSIDVGCSVVERLQGVDLVDGQAGLLVGVDGDEEPNSTLLFAATQGDFALEDAAWQLIPAAGSERLLAGVVLGAGVFDEQIAVFLEIVVADFITTDTRMVLGLLDPNAPPPTFDARYSSTSGGFSTGSPVGDFDGDGVVDWGVSLTSPPRIGLVHPSALETELSAVDIDAFIIPIRVLEDLSPDLPEGAIGDFNGDGRMDIALREVNSIPQTWLVFHGRGQ